MELELAEEWPQDILSCADPQTAELAKLHALSCKARLIRLIFRSITTSQGGDDKKNECRPLGLQDVLSSTLNRMKDFPQLLNAEPWSKIQETLQDLRDNMTSGLVSFLDAVPANRFKVDLDILNPHYPDYY